MGLCARSLHYFLATNHGPQYPSFLTTALRTRYPPLSGIETLDPVLHRPATVDIPDHHLKASGTDEGCFVPGSLTAPDARVSWTGDKRVGAQDACAVDGETIKKFCLLFGINGSLMAQAVPCFGGSGQLRPVQIFDDDQRLAVGRRSRAADGRRRRSSVRPFWASEMLDGGRSRKAGELCWQRSLPVSAGRIATEKMTLPGMISARISEGLAWNGEKARAHGLLGREKVMSQDARC